MQGINEIVRQNAEVSAIRLAKETGEPHFVVQDAPGRYEVTKTDPGPGNAVFIGRPDFPTEV